MTKTLHLTVLITLTALVALTACSRVPACNDGEALKLVYSEAKEQVSAQLRKRFTIPFLSPQATEALAAFFGPDNLGVREMRTVAVNKEIGQRRCEATIEYHYVMEGRLEKAKAALEHGAVTGQTVAYMLDGEPYLSAVRKLGEKIEGPLTYTTQRTDDGKIHVEIESRDLPIF